MAENWKYNQIDEIIQQFFTVTSITYRSMERSKDSFQPQLIPVYEILRRSDLGGNIKHVNETLRNLGYMSFIRPHPLQESRGMLYIFPIPEKMITPTQNLRTPLIMLVLTILSVFFVGVLKWEVLSTDPLILGAYYVISLMGIVGIHEIGHMVASRLHGIKSSWPHFIPIPIGLGTLGAFISQKTPIKSKNDLFDVGLSGPIFGLIAAIFFSIIGFINTIFVSETTMLADSTEFGFGILMNDPDRLRILLFEILRIMLVPEAGANMVPVFHPFAYAGWVGFLITGINLIPIGQSDGGHIARSIFSEKNHRMVTYFSAFVLIILGFWFFALLLLYMYSQTGHTGPLDDLTELSLSRKLVATVGIILIVLCLPIPSNIFSKVFPGLL